MALVQHFPALTPVPEPVCSVCIANYNGVEVLADCIDSVLAQQGGIPVEIIVHDDASTDGSVEWIRQHYPDIGLLAASENAGFCVANNRMVAQARGEFVLLLNNDAALCPDALQVLVDAARGQPLPGIYTVPQYDWQSGDLVDRGCLLDPFYNPVPNLDADRHDVAYVIGACLFTSRALWNELGGFPEWFGSIAEDMYLCCLARLRGLPVVAVAASGYRHRQGASFGGNRAGAGGLSTTYRRRALSERNKTAVMAACTPGWCAWPLLALHLSLLCAEGALLSVVKRSSRPWHKIYSPVMADVWRMRTSILVQRRSVQAKRTCTFQAYLRGVTPWPRKLIALFRHGVPDIH